MGPFPRRGQPCLERSVQVEVGDARRASSEAEPCLDKAALGGVELDAVEVDQCERQVRVRRRMMAAYPEGLSLIDRGAGEPERLRAVALPRPDQRERAEHIDVPDRIAHARERADLLQRSRGAVEIAGEEVREARRVLAHGLDRICPADAEEVHDVLRPESRDRSADLVGDLQHRLGRQVTKCQQRVQGVRGRALAEGEVCSPDDPPIGLPGCGGIVRPQLGRQEVDLHDRRRAVGVIHADIGQPAHQGGGFAPLEQTMANGGDDAKGLLRVPDIEQVIDSLLLASVAEQPPGRPVLQVVHGAWVLDLEPVSQHLGEQVVVAICLPGRFEWDEEHRLPVQLVKQAARVACPRDGVAELGREPIEHRGVEQEVPHLRILAFNHLVEQVLRDEVVAPRERLDERGGIRCVTQRDGRQLQPDRPTVRAVHEAAHQFVGQLTLCHVLDELAGLRIPEGEIGAPDLHDLVGEAETVQVPRQVPSGGDDGPSGVRKGGEQLAEVVEHGTTRQRMRVFQEKHDIRGERCEAGDQAVDEDVAETGAALSHALVDDRVDRGATDHSASTRSLASTTASSCRRVRAK